MEMARAWSDKNPVGWVPVFVVRAVEKGRKRGWLVVNTIARYSTIDGKRKKNYTLHPDRVDRQ